MPRRSALESPAPEGTSARVFRHSGRLGDVVYALPSLRAPGRATLLLRAGEELSEGGIAALLPLLRLQPCLETAAPWEGEKFDVDLDAFREERVYWTNLADAHASVLQRAGIAVDEPFRDAPWLAVDYAYDNAGNMTLENRGGIQTSYGDDGENRMARTTQPDGSRITMTYGGDGLRRTRQTGSKPVTYVWDGSDYLGEVNS